MLCFEQCCSSFFSDLNYDFKVKKQVLTFSEENKTNKQHELYKL